MTKRSIVLTPRAANRAQQLKLEAEQAKVVFALAQSAFFHYIGSLIEQEDVDVQQVKNPEIVGSELVFEFEDDAETMN